MAEPTVSSEKLTISIFTKAVSSKAELKIRGEAPLDNAPDQDVDVVWKKIFDVAEKYDNGMCKSLNDHIDTVLVFAGLFSAVVTAFAIESYKWLHDDSGDATVQLLAQIAGTLPPTTSALSYAQAIRINAYWFLALLLSLSSAFVAILARQWILEFERRYRQSNRDGLAVRQAKLAGLESWHVDRYASTYPLMLLQVSLLLFITGILDLLWTLNKQVAVPAIVVSTILAAMYVVTTILPCVQLAYVSWTGIPGQKLSPHQSPQAWILLSLFAAFLSRCSQLRWAFEESRSLSSFVDNLRSWRNRMCSDSQSLPGDSQSSQNDSHSLRRDLQSLRDTDSWIDYDVRWTILSESRRGASQTRHTVDRVNYAFDAAAWLQRRLSGSEIAEPIWRCLWAYAATLGDPMATVLEKQRVASALGYLTPPRFECGSYHPVIQPWILLLDLADAKGTDPVLIFELLHLAQHASQLALKRPDSAPEPLRRRLQPELMLELICAAEERLPSQNVDEETCRHLLATLSESGVWGDKIPVEFIEAAGIALGVLARTVSIPLDNRTCLIADICHRLRMWLLRPCPDSSPNSVSRTAYFATRLVLQAIDHLGINILEELDPDAHEVKAVAGLASAASALSPELFALLAYLRSPEQDVRPGIPRLLALGDKVNAERKPGPKASAHPAGAADSGPSGAMADTGPTPTRPDEPALATQPGDTTTSAQGSSGTGPAAPGEGQPASVSDTPAPAGGRALGQASKSPSSAAATSISVNMADSESAASGGPTPVGEHRSLLGNVPEKDLERGNGSGEDGGLKR